MTTSNQDELEKILEELCKMSECKWHKGVATEWYFDLEKHKPRLKTALVSYAQKKVEEERERITEIAKKEYTESIEYKLGEALLEQLSEVFQKHEPFEEYD